MLEQPHRVGVLFLALDPHPFGHPRHGNGFEEGRHPQIGVGRLELEVQLGVDGGLNLGRKHGVVLWKWRRVEGNRRPTVPVPDNRSSILGPCDPTAPTSIYTRTMTRATTMDTATMQDAETVISKARLGDPVALEALYRAYSGPVYN